MPTIDDENDTSEPCAVCRHARRYHRDGVCMPPNSPQTLNEPLCRCSEFEAEAREP